MSNPVTTTTDASRFRFSMRIADAGSVPADVTLLNGRVEAYLHGRGAASGEVVAAMTAVEEILTNLGKYGSGPDGAPVTAEGDLLLTDAALSLTVVDDSFPFDPLSLRPPDTDLPLEEREVGGLGLYLVAQMFPDAAYHRRDGHNVSVWRRPLAGGDS